MKKNVDSLPSSLQIPLPAHLSHDGITFVPVCSSHRPERLSDEVVAALGTALFDVTNCDHSESTVSTSVWKTAGKLESIQRSER